MAGKNCVGICSDLRLGAQAQTVAMNFRKVSWTRMNSPAPIGSFVLFCVVVRQPLSVLPIFALIFVMPRLLPGVRGQR